MELVASYRGAVYRTVCALLPARAEPVIQLVRGKKPRFLQNRPLNVVTKIKFWCLIVDTFAM